MKRKAVQGVILAALTGLLISCGNTGVEPVEDSNDFDAIYNIIRYDRPDAFNLDLLDFSIPDTTMIMPGLYQPIHFWRELDSSTPSVDIDINEPGPNDSLGAVRWAAVTYLKRFQGSFEVIALDTSGGSNTPIRMTKPFDFFGRIHAIFEKVGFDHNTRRGWKLSRIGDAFFTAGTNPAADVIYWEADYPAVKYDLKYDVVNLSDLPEFGNGDSLEIVTITSDPENKVNLRFNTANGWVNRWAELDSIVNQGSYFSTGFSPISGIGSAHFVVDVISIGSVGDTTRYSSTSIGCIYKRDNN